MKNQEANFYASNINKGTNNKLQKREEKSNIKSRADNSGHSIVFFNLCFHDNNCFI